MNRQGTGPQREDDLEASQKTGSQRVLAIDWLRGFVMVLMTWDHASAFFYAGRVADDSATSYVVGTEQTVVRWAIDKTLLQVLYAIACGFWAMIVLRRIPSTWLLGGVGLWWV